MDFTHFSTVILPVFWTPYSMDSGVAGLRLAAHTSDQPPTTGTFFYYKILVFFSFPPRVALSNLASPLSVFRNRFPVHPAPSVAPLLLILKSASALVARVGAFAS